MKVQINLSLDECSNAQVLINGDGYVTSMTGNTYFAPAAILELLAVCRSAVT